MPSYSGPIYFEAVPCSPSCNRYPSALASTSRLPSCWTCSRAAIASSRSSFHPIPAEEQEEDFEWARLDSETKIDAVSTRASRHASSASCMNDVQRPFRAEPRSFDLLPAASTRTRTPALAMAYQNDDETSEMTPVDYSWNARTASHRQPGKIREQSGSSRISLSSAAGVDISSISKPFSTYGRAGSNSSDSSRHAHSARSSIWSWASGVDSGQYPLLHQSAPLRSDSLQVPCDVDMDRDVYSPRTVPSFLHSHHLSAPAEMSASSSSRSSPLSTDRRTRAFDSTSFSSDRGNEEGGGGSLNDWQHMMDETAPSFLAFSPCPSSCSSTMGFTSTLPREHVTLDETAYRTLLDKWTEAEEWKEEADREREGSTHGVETQYDIDIDTYPRSAASSPHLSDVEMHPAVLPALLDQHDFSTLMLQSFRLALAEAKLLEGDGFEGFNAAAEAAVEDDRASIASFPSHLQDFDDIADQWSPPALRSSSSASSLDPFHLELFSPQSEQTDPAAVWEAHRSPGDSSDSREYFSSSPFVGWSSSSDADAKPALLTLHPIPPSIPPVAGTPLAEVPLYQPQPIRPIRPIDIAANLAKEFPEGSC